MQLANLEAVDLPEIPHRLPDQLRPNLRLVFVGTAASTRSAAVGHYYAHPGNRFWRAIHEAGITPRRYQPGEFAMLLELGIGFTDLSKSGAGMDHQIATETIDVPGFRAKIENISAADDCVHEQEGRELVLRQAVEWDRAGAAAARGEAPRRVRAALAVRRCVRSLDAGALAGACGVDRCVGRSTPHRPHPEETAQRSSRRMAAGDIRACMVRDGASRLLTMRS